LKCYLKSGLWMLIIKGIWVPLHFCGILIHEKKVFWRKNDIPLLKIIVTWDGLFQVMKPLQSYHSKAVITNWCVKAVRCDFLKFRWEGNEASWLKDMWSYWISLVVSNLFHWLSLLITMQTGIFFIIFYPFWCSCLWFLC
jgi:hypothetical protein